MKKVLSAGVMLLACCACLPTAYAQTESTAAAQPGNEAVREATPKNPQDAASYYAIGMSHYESKRFREAVEAFKQSIRLGSTDPKTYFSLGQAYYSLNLYKEARESYKRAAKVKPDWAEAHYQLGWMYHILGDKAAAQAQYKILQTLNPEMAESFQKLLGNDAKPATTPTTDAANLNASTTEPASTSTTTDKDAAQATTPEASSSDNNQAASSSPANTSSSVDASSQSPATAATEVANQQPAASEATTNATTNGAPVNTAANGTNANPSAASAPSTSAPAKDETTTTTTAEPVASSSNSEMPPTSIYRVGVGDVLDIRLLNTPNSRSTLFTVMSGGLIEYPLVGGSFTVAGLTTEEIGARLSAELKRRALGNDSQVVVGVRDYSSHVVIVSGLVNYPGRKILQREAVPLYVIAAEAQLRPDAGRAVIMRANESIPVNDLTDPLALNVLVRAGDVITVSARQPLYYFIGGRIHSPGQKSFQHGITLIQAILAAGGLSRAQDTVEISREEPDGRLTTTKYALKEIKSGKIPDPRLQPGDRIQVGQ